MKKTKGTGVMLFGMFAIIVIIAVFILAGNGAKKRRRPRKYVWDFFFTGGMIPLSAPCVLISKKRRKNMNGQRGSR